MKTFLLDGAFDGQKTETSVEHQVEKYEELHGETATHLLGDISGPFRPVHTRLSRPGQDG